MPAISSGVVWSSMSQSLLVRDVRLVSVSSASGAYPVHVRIRDDRIAEISPTLKATPGEEILDAGGRWGIPGLWDHHVHMRQWAERQYRLDLSLTGSAREVLDTVKGALRDWQRRASAAPQVLVGAGFRIAGWPDSASTQALDAISSDTAVVLIAGDGHCGWMNSRAHAFFGITARDGLLEENEWFAVYARLGELTSGANPLIPAFRSAIADAHALGIVGITDFEYADTFRTWPELVHHDVGKLKVRAGFYPEALGAVRSLGLNTGDELAPLVTMGPLKIIADGSLNTMTALCCNPYGDPAAPTFGTQNYSQDELTALLETAKGCGLDGAVHAIGDAAVHDALDAFAATGARGSIEHAQLLCVDDILRMADLNIVASVQPAHLIDDFDVAHAVWADRVDRCYLFASMVRAGVRVALGSDAPVSPLNPWLAMNAAVTRRSASGDIWNSGESLTPEQALLASTNGIPAIAVDGPGDLVLLNHNPLLDPLEQIEVAATVVAGAVVFERTA